MPSDHNVVWLNSASKSRNLALGVPQNGSRDSKPEGSRVTTNAVRGAISSSLSEVLDDSSFLKVFLSTNYDFGGSEIPVYQKFAWPEGWNFRTRIEEHIKLCHPDLYVRLRADRSSRRR
jgi:hypothetical protein